MVSWIWKGCLAISREKMVDLERAKIVLQEKKFAMDNTIIIPYSDVESKKEWLWKYRLPHKNVAFLYGSSEDAVEALIAEIIASVSMGRALAVDNMSRQAG